MDLFNLPIIIIENIIKQLTYDEMARVRIVSKAFNEICMRMLNRGFHMIEKRHALALKTVKAQLPRRESERRYHPLARHCDILTSIETRISMLNMTYSKFIDSGMCCFIPGRVIDEIQRILEMVDTCKSPPRAHEVLQELRDISSMAIEHFDDKISPAFRKRLQDITVTIPIPRPVHVTTITPTATRQEFIHLRQMSTANAKLSLFLSSQYKMFYKQMTLYKRIALRQKRTIRDLSKRQREQEATICELKKRLDECDVKYSELTHTNQAVGGKSMGESSVSGGSKSQSLRHFGSQIKLDLSLLPIGNSKLNQKLLPNIKPRKAQIKLPSICDDESPDHKEDPIPSTSGCSSSTRTRSQTAIGRIRGLAYEITALSNNLSKSLESKPKRTANRQDNGEPSPKKQRME
ncbi:PREDICTED: F-box only protein 28 isoform X1 [Papilio xuthus]|uniref:F-box only protein 28 isoform X1 n=1 Tax=Papilio xuthus TaxID=66420 RepID=A0AAJ6ZT20_PAPXU|nr:PREDICTED: F-box only protein 28 isoform X1 [Papilio xuthus]